MPSITVTYAREHFSDIVNEAAFKGNRQIISRNGKEICAIVSSEDARLLEALEDKYDLKEALARLSENQAPVPYDSARAELDLD